MRPLRGRVASCSKLSIQGWALSPDDEIDRPEIEISQSGITVFTIIPNIVDAALRPVLKLQRSSQHNLCRWRIMLPLSVGIAPDKPFTIKFRATGNALEQGEHLLLPLFDETATLARQVIDDYISVTASYKETSGGVTGALFVAARNLRTATATIDGRPTGDSRIARTLPGRELFGHPGVHVPFESASLVGPHVAVSLNLEREGNLQSEVMDPVKSLYVPAEVFQSTRQGSLIPDAENMRRVAGQVNSLHFLVGGFTHFMQMSSLSLRYFGKPLAHHSVICDWGVGCGRVLRYFPDETTGQGRRYQRLIGLDVDQYNIDWCKTNLKFAEFVLLDRHIPSLPIETATVELLYANSVMTHLSEHDQLSWLEEIHRIMKPGGCVILTTNGETALYQRPELLQYYFATKFGFSDLQPDTTFGEEISQFYRVTYQTQEHIRSNWGKFFEVLAIEPAKQDYVVMRR